MASPRAPAASPVPAAPVVNTVAVNAPRSWAESQTCASENQAPPVVLASPAKAAAPKEVKTPNTRSRAAKEATANKEAAVAPMP